jgi:hypothetical protein
MGFDYFFLILQKNSSNILSEVINNYNIRLTENQVIVFRY